MIIAGGAITKPTSDITGSWITITANRPISVSTSRPIEVISSDSTRFAAVAPVVSRAMNSEEWRSEKKPMFSVQQLVEHAPLVVGHDAVADPHHDDLLAVGRRALQGEQSERRDADPHQSVEILVHVGLVDDVAEQVGGRAPCTPPRRPS